MKLKKLSKLSAIQILRESSYELSFLNAFSQILPALDAPCL